MLIMIMLVAAACGDKADNTAATEEPTPTETTTGTDSDTANTEETEKTEPASEESKETDNSQDVELGTTEKGSYNNDYFGVSLKFPEAWEFQDAAGMNELTSASSEAIAGDDETKKNKSNCLRPKH